MPTIERIGQGTHQERDTDIYWYMICSEKQGAAAVPKLLTIGGNVGRSNESSWVLLRRADCVMMVERIGLRGEARIGRQGIVCEQHERGKPQNQKQRVWVHEKRSKEKKTTQQTRRDRTEPKEIRKRNGGDQPNANGVKNDAIA